jgi:hypothetical protein
MLPLGTLARLPDGGFRPVAVHTEGPEKRII